MGSESQCGDMVGLITSGVSQLRAKMMKEAGDSGEMEGWLKRMYDEENAPEENLFRGVTTNPPLSYAAIKDNP